MPGDSYVVQKIVLILCVSSILLSLAVFITVLVIKIPLSGSRTYPAYLTSHYVCPNDVEDLKVSEEQRNISNLRILSKGDGHCVHISNTLSTHFKKVFITSQAKEEWKIKPLGFEKAFAFRRMVLSNESGDNTLEFMSNTLDHGKDLERNISFTSSKVIIHRKGFYHILISIHFKTRTDCGNFGNMSIFRRRSGEDKLLLQTSQPLCDDHCNLKNTSYIASGFVLEPNDILYVEVSDKEYVRYREETTFFGVIMLTDLEDG